MSSQRAMVWSLETPRLKIAPYHPLDAQRYVEIVARNRQHLSPWMPFATFEPDMDLYVGWFEDFQRRALGGDYSMSLRTHDGRIVGGGGVHPSVGAMGREVGYWVTQDVCGHGFAGEAVAAFCHLAFVGQQGVDRVELRIDPDNAPSVRVAQKAGFELEGRLRRRIPFPGQPPRDALLYTLFAEDWPQSPLAAVEVKAFDAAGRLVESETQEAL